MISQVMIITFLCGCISIYSHYKNKVDQCPGWNPEILKWCVKEAKEKQLKESDHWGRLILDEMKIQVSCIT